MGKGEFRGRFLPMQDAFIQAVVNLGLLLPEIYLDPLIIQNI